MGCGAEKNVVASAGVTVSDPWIRTPPPFSNTAALYTVIKNDNTAADSLIAIESPSCESFVLHRTTTDSGIATMTEITGEGLEVGSGEFLILEPGGLHGMCLGLVDSLADGDQVDVELNFATAGRVSLSVPVERR
jgi:copper(I)-binding protein